MADPDQSTYLQDQYNLARQQQLANFLRAQSQQPVGSQVGGRVVAATPLEVLAKLGSGYFANAAEAKANQSAINLAQTKQAMMANALRQYNQTGDATVLTNSGIPELQAAGTKIATTPEKFGTKPAFDQSGNAYVVGDRGTPRMLPGMQQPQKVITLPNGGVTTQANIINQLGAQNPAGPQGAPASPQLPTPTGPQITQGPNGPMSVPASNLPAQGANPTPAPVQAPLSGAPTSGNPRIGILDYSDPNKLINPVTGQPNQTAIDLRNQEMVNRIKEAAAMRPPPAPTVTTIADPNNPDKAIVIDAKTGRKIGDAKPSADTSKMGAREAQVMGRIVMSANQAAHDLENVSKLPLTASSGIFGGRKQGPSLMSAGVEDLANTMTPQEAQSYNVMSSGFQRSLAGIEAAGMMPNGTLSHQMDSVLFREGDTNLTKLQKLAQTRQIIESGLDTIIDNPRVPDETKTAVKKIIDKVQAAVPFTHEDIQNMSQAQLKNPKLTLSDIVKAKGAKASPAAGQPTTSNW